MQVWRHRHVCLGPRLLAQLPADIWCSDKPVLGPGLDNACWPATGHAARQTQRLWGVRTGRTFRCGRRHVVGGRRRV